MEGYKDIYVYIEQREGVIQDVSLELVSEAVKLQKRLYNFDIVGVLIGSDVAGLADTVIGHGANKVIVIDNPELKIFDTLLYTEALEQVIEAHKPDSFLFGASYLGRDLAPRVAARVNTGLTADATILEVDPENADSSLLWITRPAFGGNIYGTIICPDHRPQMATVRPGILVKNEFDASLKGEIINFDVKLNNTNKVKLLDHVKKISDAIDITKAEIIIAGGRGVKDKFNVLETCANELGAVVAASRGAVDAGNASKDIQVGQTGKSVRPKIYIACGISGAVQHLAGMENSDYIISINTDENAPIFAISNMALVGDALSILPELTSQLKAHKEAK